MKRIAGSVGTADEYCNSFGLVQPGHSLIALLPKPLRLLAQESIIKVERHEGVHTFGNLFLLSPLPFSPHESEVLSVS